MFTADPMVETREDYSPEERNQETDASLDGPPSADGSYKGSFETNCCGYEPSADGSYPQQFVSNEPLLPSSESSGNLWTLADIGVFLVFALASMVIAAGTVMGGFTTLNRVLHLGMSSENAVVQTVLAVS